MSDGWSGQQPPNGWAQQGQPGQPMPPRQLQQYPAPGMQYGQPYPHPRRGGGVGAGIAFVVIILAVCIGLPLLIMVIMFLIGLGAMGAVSGG